MSLPLHEHISVGDGLVRVTVAPLDEVETSSALMPNRPLAPGEQYRFHFDMTKCIGCRSCEVACNWRRIGEIEGRVYPDTRRHYLSMGCNHCLDPDCLRGCPVNAWPAPSAMTFVTPWGLRSRRHDDQFRYARWVQLRPRCRFCHNLPRFAALSC